jgi:hypothetical protein
MSVRDILPTLAVVTAVVAVGLVAVGAAGGGRSAPPSAATFDTPKPTFEFGTVVAGMDVEHIFRLINQGDEPAGATWTLPVTLKTDRLHGEVRKQIVVHVRRAVPADYYG